jgi:hypothetical protein
MAWTQLAAEHRSLAALLFGGVHVAGCPGDDKEVKQPTSELITQDQESKIKGKSKAQNPSSQDQNSKPKAKSTRPNQEFKSKPKPKSQSQKQPATRSITGVIFEPFEPPRGPDFYPGGLQPPD